MQQSDHPWGFAGIRNAEFLIDKDEADGDSVDCAAFCLPEPEDIIWAQCLVEGNGF